MPLVTDRSAVVEIYARAVEDGWVIPAICSENVTSSEAIVAAAKAHGNEIGRPDLPVCIAITNLYHHRQQALNYTHTGNWRVGMRLFLADLAVLAGPDSPYRDLQVMVHLDHIEHDRDRELLGWDFGAFSSIMFDASTLPFDDNIEATQRFVEERGGEIFIEGACDEIVNATGEQVGELTTPERADRFLRETGADLIVANLGTEHRASAADLKYHSDVAQRIKAVVGTRMCLHGCSSVPVEELGGLAADGICKGNIWTMIERDTTPVLFREMVANAAKVAGPTTACELRNVGLLGPEADLTSAASLDHFTTCYRQGIVYPEMKKIVRTWLRLWMPGTQRQEGR